MGQNRSGAALATIQQGLWQRGAPGDLALIRVLRELHPAHPCPEVLRIGPNFQVCPAPDARDAVEVRALLGGQYWWPEPVPPQQIEEAHAQSAAWLVVRDAGGVVVGSARALSDGVRLARVCDVVVRPALRGQGLGTALMRTLLDHPRLRHVERATLGTRDGQAFYRRLGFSELAASHTEMQRPSSA